MTEGARESKALETVEKGPPVVTWLGSAPMPPPPPLLPPLELVVGLDSDPLASASLPELGGLGVLGSGRRGGVLIALGGGEGPLLLGIEDSEGALISTGRDTSGLVALELDPPMMLVLMMVSGAVGHDWTVGTVG